MCVAATAIFIILFLRSEILWSAPPVFSVNPVVNACSNPAWGYRNTDDIAGLAQAQGLKLVAIEPMPANNFQMIFSAEKQGA